MRLLSIFLIIFIGYVGFARADEEPKPIREGGFKALTGSEVRAYDEVKKALIAAGVQAEVWEKIAADKRAGYYDDVVPQMTKPAEKSMTYERYRNIFIKPERLKEGMAFLEEHQSELAAAGEKYAVDKAALAGLIGVETRFGRHKGRYRALNALATIAIGYPRRRAWAVNELATLIKLYEKHDVLAVMGSYAGAIGYPQFMPSSIKAYGVDENGDGFIDLGNWPEAIASCANYLHRHGFKNGVAIEPGSATYKAIYRYNPSAFYVQIVGEMAEQFGYQPKNPHPFYVPAADGRTE